MSVAFDFRGKVALITGIGSRSGIGRAILHGFARAGAHVAGCDVDESGLHEAQDAFPHALIGVADVRAKDAVAAFVDRVVQAFGHIDFLVNNAGIAPFCPILDLEEAVWDATFATNVKGYFLVAQAVARRMVARGRGGCIVNIGSVSVYQSGEHKVHYCASKAAVGSLTKGLALELSRYNIRVNGVDPGTVDTAIVKEGYVQEMVETVRADPGLPINRLAVGGDLVGSVLFLCSDAAAYITGAALVVDGGMLAGTLLPAQTLSAHYRGGSPVTGSAQQG